MHVISALEPLICFGWLFFINFLSFSSLSHIKPAQHVLCLELVKLHHLKLGTHFIYL